MSSPGGREVGRVSIRVVPNTSKFDKDLKKQLKAFAKSQRLKIPVEFVADQDSLRKTLEKVRVPRVRVPVELNLPSGDTLRVTVGADTGPAEKEVDGLVRETQAKRPELTVRVNSETIQRDIERSIELADLRAKVELDTARFEQQLDAVEAANRDLVRIRAKLEIDRSGMTKFLDGIRGGVETAGRLFSGVGSLVRGVFSGIGGVISGVFARVGVDAGGAASALVAVAKRGLLVAGVIFEIGSQAAGAFLKLLKIGAIATAIAVGGAAITAAWGGISTVIAAIPAALGLLAVPLATVALGMDGIKKAAKALAPEFNRLKASVSATFEEGFTKVFTLLKGQLDALTPSVNKVAVSISGLAERTARWIALSGGAKIIQDLFTNVALAIDKINLEPLLDGLLRLAGNQAALGALVGMVNQLGVEIQRIANNSSLTAAFQGLEGVLVSLTSAFGDLVNNGIKLFAAAAPGVKSFLDDLAQFFNRFDWTSLGESVGGVFRGLGEAIRTIPPGTITAIEQAFARLATTFQSDAFASGIRGFAEAMPLLITALDIGVQTFAKLGEVVGGFVRSLEPVGKALSGMAPLLGPLSPAARAAGEALQSLGRSATAGAEETRASVEKNFGPLPAEIGRTFGLIGPVVTKELGAVGAAVDAGLINIPPTVAQALAGTVPAAQGALTPLPGAAGAAVAPVVPAIVDPLKTLPDVLGGIGSGLPKAFTDPLQVLPNQAVTLAERVVGGFGTGMAGLSPAMQRELGLLPPELSTGLGALQPPATAGTEGIVAAVGAGMTGVQAAFQAGFIGLAPFITQHFAGLSVQAAMGMATLSQGVTQGFVAVNGAFQAGFLALAPIVVQSFAGLSVQAAMGMSTLSQGVTQGFVAVNAAFTVGMAGLVPAVTVGMVGVTTAVTAGMVGVQTAMTTSLAGITTAISTAGAGWSAAMTTSLAGITTAISTAGAGWSAAMTTSLAGVNTAAVEGMAQALASVTTGATQIQEALSTAGAGLVTNMQTTMDGLVAAVRAGADQAVAAVRDAGAQMTTAIDTNAMNPVGTALMDGLKAGILAKAGEIAAAAANVVRQAIAAAHAAANTGSPSKEMIFLGRLMGEGAEVGLLDMARRVAKAGATVAQGAVDAATRVAKALDLAVGVGDFGDKLTARARHEVSLTAPKRGSEEPARQIITNVYNPLAERASDSLARRARTLSVIGAF